MAVPQDYVNIVQYGAFVKRKLWIFYENSGCSQKTATTPEYLIIL